MLDVNDFHKLLIIKSLIEMRNLGELKIRIHKIYQLSEAKEAHKDLEERKKDREKGREG